MLKLFKENHSALDGSAKYLFEMDDKWKFEAILFSVDRFNTGYIVCISTQSGCNMHCAFCATGRLGHCFNLPAETMLEALDVITEKNPDKKIIMVALMGMGEPLMNYDNVLRFHDLAKAKYDCTLSLSTVGVADKIRSLADTDTDYKLYISLHFSDDEKRTKYMPINKGFYISELINACEYYHKKRPEHGKIEASYLLLKGINDTDEDIEKLSEILDPDIFSIQLLLYNSTEPDNDAVFKRMDMESAEVIEKKLADKGFEVYIMPSAGTDISGGCGQMAEKY